MKMNKFQVTEEDVVNVLQSNELTDNAMSYLHKDGESMQSMAREIFRELDFNAIEKATQGFTFRDEQIDHGCAEIERQLRSRGTLKPSTMNPMTPRV